MKTNNKLMAMLLLAAVLAVGFVIIEDLDQNDAEGGVAKIGSKEYNTLSEAVTAAVSNSGCTIELLQNCSGDGIIVPSGSNFTIDFKGFTYTVNANPAGSTGTKNQCFQLLKNSTIVMKNGSIKADLNSIRMIIQNYCNLTLTDMTLDATVGSNNVSYVLSNNCGTVTIDGSTSLKAKSGGIAFDACWAPNKGYPAGTQITVNTTGKISGKVEFDLWGSNVSTEMLTTLTIKKGEFDGSLILTGLTEEQVSGKISVEGGTFKDLSFWDYLSDSADISYNGTSADLKDLTLSANQKLTNEGTLKSSGGFINNGTITNNGTIDCTAGNAITCSGNIEGGIIIDGANAYSVTVKNGAVLKNIEFKSVFSPDSKSAIVGNDAKESSASITGCTFTPTSTSNNGKFVSVQSTNISLTLTDCKFNGSYLISKGTAFSLKDSRDAARVGYVSVNSTHDYEVINNVTIAKCTGTTIAETIVGWMAESGTTSKSARCALSVNIVGGTYDLGDVSFGDGYTIPERTIFKLSNNATVTGKFIGTQTDLDSGAKKGYITATIESGSTLTIKSGSQFGFEFNTESVSKQFTNEGNLILQSDATIPNEVSILNSGVIKIDSSLSMAGTGEIDPLSTGTVLAKVSVPGSVTGGTIVPATDGYAIVGKTITLTDAKPIADNDLEAVASEGYVFSKWTLTLAADPSADTSEITTVPYAAITMTPSFVVPQYSVTFVGNYDGSTYSESVAETLGAKYQFPQSNPARDGYTMVGWYTESVGGTLVDSNTVVTSSASGQTLYAHWELIPASSYAVSFMNKGSVYQTLYVEAGKTVMKIDAPEAETGYKFVGWMTQEEGTTRFDFSTPITQDTNIYAKWSNQTVVTLPDAEDAVGYTITTNSDLSGDYNRSFTMTITPISGYTISSVWAIDDITAQRTSAGGDYTFNVTEDCSVYVEVTETATGKQTETAKTVVENDDSSTTTIKTTVETENGSKTITESASKTAGTTAASESTTTARMTDSSAIVTIETTDDAVSTVSETLVDAIKEAAGTGTVSLDLTVATPAVVIPKSVMNNDTISDITVTVNQGSSNGAVIIIPSNALAAADIGETFSVSVTESAAQVVPSAIGGSSSTAAFDLNIIGTATTEFQSSVTVSMTVELPAGANNVRFYCIDNGDVVDATYSDGVATASLGHFSAWTIVYDKPVIIIEDDDDILFILEQQKKAQEAASSQTTTGDDSGEEAAIIIAAAAVAGAMLACAFFAFRRN